MKILKVNEIFYYFVNYRFQSDLNISHGKKSDFDSFLLFGFILVIKLENFDFESHRNTLIFFDKKNDFRFEYVLSNGV